MRTDLSLHLATRFFLDRSRGLIGWLIGLVLYAALMVSFFPTIRDSESYEAALDDYPDALKEFFGGEANFQLTTGPGYINAQLYSFMMPLLLTIVAVGIGAALGADQRSGLMDLMLANPVPRWRVIVGRAVAMTASVILLAGGVGLCVALVGGVVDLGIGVNELAAATTATVLIVLLHGLIALAVAATTGRRSIAIGVATAVFAAGYLVQSLAGLVEAIEPFRVLSPYHHALGTSPLVDGWAPGSLGLLVALCAMALTAAIILFQRRDLA